ncbi:MAG: hypothetical protein J2P31_18375 [Blastocatellia bacterium]|nr:hypothetical protein [Blastocatellia bacterium]
MPSFPLNFHKTSPTTTTGADSTTIVVIGQAIRTRSIFLNKWNQSWDVKNVFVTDGACYVSQGCQNPTLTMMAITARACDYLAEEFRKQNL